MSYKHYSAFSKIPAVFTWSFNTLIPQVRWTRVRKQYYMIKIISVPYYHCSLLGISRPVLEELLSCPFLTSAHSPIHTLPTHTLAPSTKRETQLCTQARKMCYFCSAESAYTGKKNAKLQYFAHFLKTFLATCDNSTWYSSFVLYNLLSKLVFEFSGQENLRIYSLLYYTLTASFAKCCKTQMRWDQAL